MTTEASGAVPETVNVSIAPLEKIPVTCIFKSLAGVNPPGKLSQVITS